MMASTNKTTVAVSGLTIALALSGCWASKEETATQLNRHIKAYESVTIKPGNAKSLIKGVELLMSNSEKNNFRKELDGDQRSTLLKIKAAAETVSNCTDTLSEYARSPKGSKAKGLDQMSIQALESTLAPLRKANECVGKADILNTQQVTSLKSSIEELETALQKAVSAEAAKKAAEEAAKKAAIEARENRVNRFIARTGMSRQSDSMRQNMDRAMLRVIETNCEEWLPSSCMREYGITIDDFSYVREKLGL